MTTLRDALGRDITVMSTAGILRREEGDVLTVERAAVVVFIDIESVFFIDRAAGKSVRAFDRWMYDLGLNQLSDVDAEPRPCDWELRPDGTDTYAVARPAAGAYLATNIGNFPPRWWHLVATQHDQVPLLASCAPLGPNVRREWTDPDEIHIWLDGAARASKLWGGKIAAVR